MIKQISLKIQRLRLERERCNGQIVDYRGKEREKREKRESERRGETKKRKRRGMKKKERERESNE